MISLKVFGPLDQALGFSILIILNPTTLVLGRRNLSRIAIFILISVDIRLWSRLYSFMFPDPFHSWPFFEMHFPERKVVIFLLRYYLFAFYFRWIRANRLRENHHFLLVMCEILMTLLFFIFISLYLSSRRIITRRKLSWATLTVINE